MTKKETILVVDDSSIDRRMLISYLKDYAVIFAADGKSALVICQQQSHPDLILMDVEMPYLDGYSTCKSLKENELTRDIPVIFVSVHHKIEEIVKGYDSGAIDYISKPINADEFTKKIALALENQKKLKNLAIQNLNLNLSVHNIEDNLSEQDIIIKYLLALNESVDIKGLGEVLKQSLQDFGLKGSIQVRHELGKINYSLNDSIITGMENLILSKYKTNKPVFSYNQRLIISYKWISLFVKTLPDDSIKKERLIKHLQLMLKAANDKLSLLVPRCFLHQQVISSQHILDELEQEQIRHKEMSLNMTEDTLINLEQSFNALGLDEKEEKILMGVVENGIDESFEYLNKGIEIDKHQRREFTKILAMIQNLASSKK